jgi:hypothetical protein
VHLFGSYYSNSLTFISTAVTTSYFIIIFNVYQTVDPKANQICKYEFSVCFKKLSTVKLLIYALQNLRYMFDAIRIPCNTLIIQHLVEQIAQSVINNHLLLMFPLRVSTSIRSSRGKGGIHRRTTAENSVKDVRV